MRGAVSPGATVRRPDRVGIARVVVQNVGSPAVRPEAGGGRPKHRKRSRRRIEFHWFQHRAVAPVPPPRVPAPRMTGRPPTPRPQVRRHDGRLGVALLLSVLVHALLLQMSFGGQGLGRPALLYFERGRLLPVYRGSPAKPSWSAVIRDTECHSEFADPCRHLECTIVFVKLHQSPKHSDVGTDAVSERTGRSIELIDVEFAKGPRQARPTLLCYVERTRIECVSFLRIGNMRQRSEQRLAITPTTPFVKFVPRHSISPHRFAIR